MKRTFLFEGARPAALVASGLGLVAATYGLVRLAYGLFLPDVQASLGLGSTASGLISAGASVAYCAGAAAGFVWASSRPRRLIVAAITGAAVGSAGMAAAPGPSVFGIAAVLASTGAGLASPALVSIVRRTVAATDDARHQAVVNAGTGPGLVGAGLLALVLLPDWRLAWYLVAGSTVAVGAAVLLLDRGRDAPTDGGRRPLPSRAWLASHRAPIASALLMGAGSAAVWSFGRTHLVAAGVGEQASVLAWIAIGVGGTAVVASAGPMGSLSPRAAWCLTTLVTGTATATIGVSTGAPALLACVAFGWGYTAGSGALIAWTTAIDPRHAPSGTSMLFVVLVLGQALGAAALGGAIPATGSSAAFVAAGTVALLAAVAPFAPSARTGSPKPKVAAGTRA
ncbi:MFS transporter [Aeromicrobium sp. Root472D3]|uniref:MFS transporter n=1 Tax=Aeromicrobium sp. Root472D3 TaxID=1736540 RepID=UPI0006FCF34D|nr:MFS transporter [Aeromicrobium sp. Root472D3]KQX73863.1 hypothetical protein ASD10_00895 [Aeromicrobium sp. Root472D3]